MAVLVESSPALATRPATLGLGSRTLLPRDPDVAFFVTLIESGGKAPLYVHNTPGAAYVRPGGQVLVRGKDSVVVKAKAQSIWDRLSVVCNQTVNGVWYLYIEMNQNPWDFGVDDANRSRWVFNVSGWKRPA